jgi:hypothetical protein
MHQQQVFAMGRGRLTQLGARILGQPRESHPQSRRSLRVAGPRVVAYTIWVGEHWNGHGSARRVASWDRPVIAKAGRGAALGAWFFTQERA